MGFPSGFPLICFQDALQPALSTCSLRSLETPFYKKRAPSGRPSTSQQSKVSADGANFPWCALDPTCLGDSCWASARPHAPLRSACGLGTASWTLSLSRQPAPQRPGHAARTRCIPIAGAVPLIASHTGRQPSSQKQLLLTAGGLSSPGSVSIPIGESQIQSTCPVIISGKLL